MSSLNEKFSALKQDALLGKVVRNSAHLFSSNSLSLALSFLMGIMAARLLGAAGFGLVGLVMGYASTVNSLLSFRMSELVVRYGGEYIERGEKDKTSVLIKSAGLAEAFVSLLAFALVVLTSGLASQYISKTPNTAWMFIAFAVGLLANFNYETSIGVLQLTDKFRMQGTINLIHGIVGVLVIAAGFIWGGGVAVVLLAYLLGKMILGLGIFLVAQIQLHRILGAGWWRAPFASIPSELARFALNSNISGTIIKIFRESEILWVGLLLNTTATGYYKVAYTIVGLLAVAADPLIATVYPELNRLVLQKAWPRLRDVLRKVTTLAFAYNLVQALGFLLFGRWILWLYGKQYVDAYPALIALLVGLAFNYTLFWNRPLLLSLGLSEYPIKVTLIVGLIKIGLAFVLVPKFGYVAAGALLSFYYIVSVGMMAWRGVREIHHQEQKI
ncbi:MAG TPA: oligosaccharide flippase family protein [Anaerolineales bacterium]|nr:oligosaccharide flippase family protein [Anaerolineales bacterium]